MSQSIPSNFWEWLFSLSRHDQVPVLITLAFLAATILILVVIVVSVTVYKIHRSRLNDALKRELLDRGMTAEDIVAIVRTMPSKSKPSRHGN